MELTLNGIWLLVIKLLNEIEFITLHIHTKWFIIFYVLLVLYKKKKLTMICKHFLHTKSTSNFFKIYIYTFDTFAINISMTFLIYLFGR